jgi:23S rRNA maturation-related 3'-5' exoribonuclease YhaM
METKTITIKITEKKLEIVKKKVDIVGELMNSDEYKKADILIKRVAKMKEEIKKYAVKNELTTIEGDKYKDDIKVREQRKIEVELIPDDIREEATKLTKMYIHYFEKMGNGNGQW